jgi:hypothetical protein
VGAARLAGLPAPHGEGNHFVQFQSTWPGERDRLFPLNLDEAMRLYGELPEKKVSFEEAFPGVEIEEA